MLKQILVALFVLFTLPAFAAGPEVIDTTKDEAAEKAAADPLIPHGTLQTACAPWEHGSLGIELNNHIGITLYMSIDSVKEKLNTEFKADTEQRSSGGAIIFRCDENDANCNQVAGTVAVTHIKDPLYAGRYKIDGEDPKHFEVKRIPSKAKCDSD